MIRISVISGKGGTGKTSLTAAFAWIHEGLVLADCDVDAANLHLVVSGDLQRSLSEPFMSGFKAVVDETACDGCGQCREVCRFHAVEMREKAKGVLRAAVKPLICEGCGCCADECTRGAVSLRVNRAGTLFTTPSRFGTLVHARLDPGEGTSGRLVTRVRQRAEEIATNIGSGIVLVDGSPGTGCPVIASIAGADAALVVTEPTLSGLDDMIRAVKLCRHFNVPAGAVINRCDLNLEVAEKIRSCCSGKGIEVLGQIPFNPVFVRALDAGITVMDCGESRLKAQLAGIWSSVLGLAEGGGHGGSCIAAK